jgi:hypothetical protein
VCTTSVSLSLTHLVLTNCRYSWHCAVSTVWTTPSVQLILWQQKTTLGDTQCNAGKTECHLKLLGKTIQSNGQPFKCLVFCTSTLGIDSSAKELMTCKQHIIKSTYLQGHTAMPRHYSKATNFCHITQTLSYLTYQVLQKPLRILQDPSYSFSSSQRGHDNLHTHLLKTMNSHQMHVVSRTDSSLNK